MDLEKLSMSNFQRKFARIWTFRKNEIIHAISSQQLSFTVSVLLERRDKG